MTWFWILVVVAVTLFDLGLIWAVMKVGWGPWMLQYPPREPTPDAVKRKFQSFRFGIMSFGGCVHVAVDEGHLHLRPILPLRWFGAGPISVPWSSIRPGRKRRPGRWLNVKIDGKAVTGPSWCLELAGEPDEGEFGNDAVGVGGGGKLI
ncbi:MAG: hypothetical protein JSV91_15265 [Phycisphaerales bacterium]|nr:MAG: hypothetical protein JSV91_15265 [Phycisphaerales bacterium]